MQAPPSWRSSWLACPRIFSTALGWTHPRQGARLKDPFGRGFVAKKTSERISEAVHGYRHTSLLLRPPGASRPFLLDGPRHQGAGNRPLVTLRRRIARSTCDHPPRPVL